MDFFLVSSWASGLFVESLALLLKKKQKGYEDTACVTKISDDAGFSALPAHA